MYNVRKIEENINMRGDFQGHFLYDEPLSPRTTFKVGGSTPLLVEPADEKSFLSAFRAVKELSLSCLVLGGGSNLVVPDEGVDYPVISTAGLDGISLSAGGRELTCGAGCDWNRIVEFCVRHRLGGLENFCGLPGTVGGAVYMNARCYDKSVSDVLAAVQYATAPAAEKLTDTAESGMTARAETYWMNKEHWDYKRSPFQNELAGCPVLSATFSVTPLDEAGTTAMEEKAQSFVADRERKGHFSYPSAGSVFKNNREFGQPSGKIVDEAGLRGLERGGAQVAPWHGNFIVNREKATAADIRELVRLVQQKVFEKTGFLLEPEIIFLPKNNEFEQKNTDNK